MSFSFNKGDLVKDKFGNVYSVFDVDTNTNYCLTLKAEVIIAKAYYAPNRIFKLTSPVHAIFNSYILYQREVNAGRIECVPTNNFVFADELTLYKQLIKNKI